MHDDGTILVTKISRRASHCTARVSDMSGMDAPGGQINLDDLLSQEDNSLLPQETNPLLEGPRNDMNIVDNNYPPLGDMSSGEASAPFNGPPRIDQRVGDDGYLGASFKDPEIKIMESPENVARGGFRRTSSFNITTRTSMAVRSISTGPT